MYQFRTNSMYSFSVLPALSGILGNEFNGVVVKGSLDRQTVEAFVDITSKFQMLAGYLPEGYSSNPDDYQYLRLLMPSGNYDYICAAWIQEDSIIETTIGNIDLRLSEVTAADLAPLRNLLVQNGYKIESIKYTQKS